MTNNPRNPLPGEEPDSPRDPHQGLGESEEQAAGYQQPSEQPMKPGQSMPASSAGARPASGSAGATPASGSTAGSATPASSASASQGRTSQPPEQTYQSTSQSYQREPGYQTTKTAPPPRKSNKKFALFGVLGLAALAGIIAGFAATNNSTPPAAAIHRPLPTHARVPSGRLLQNFSGTGGKLSPQFTATHSPLTVRWSYVCGAGTGTHRFSAGLVAVNGKDTQLIANTTGTGAGSITTVHPRYVGSKYQIGATSTCPYNVKVYAP
jgi:hypothetical protein